jgi:dTDP-4-amino-4,6-dideoxy-D-galactose acyltransferase
MVLIATIRPERSSMRPRELSRHVEVRPLKWETDFFGAPMAALAVMGQRALDMRAESDDLANELRSALREAELDGFQHVALRVLADDPAAIWAAERVGLRLMDLAVDLKHSLGTLPTVDDARVRLATPDDIPAMRAMTAGAFGLTRFALDPFFTSRQVDDFYATWATNLFAGLADVVFLSEIDGAPAGFVSARVIPNEHGFGRIPLVATARQFQRRGIARGLMAATLKWFADAGCDVAYVKTQTANYPAVALYERVGFQTSQSEITFTTTLNQE